MTLCSGFSWEEGTEGTTGRLRAWFCQKVNPCNQPFHGHGINPLLIVWSLRTQKFDLWMLPYHSFHSDATANIAPGKLFVLQNEICITQTHSSCRHTCTNITGKRRKACNVCRKSQRCWLLPPSWSLNRLLEFSRATPSTACKAEMGFPPAFDGRFTVWRPTRES